MFILVIVLVPLAAGVTFFYTEIESKNGEIASLHRQVGELEPFRADHDELQKLRSQTRALEMARQDHQELMHLRGQVTQLRTEKEKLVKQLQQPVTAANPDAPLPDQLQQLQRENAQLRQEQEEQIIIRARNACINNLRQLDGAMQQWALENKKNADSLPTTNDVAPYLKEFPACPSGGTYTLGRVDQEPKCSLTDHALPK